MAQQIVAFATGGVHVKESHQFSRCPWLAAQGDVMALVYRRCAGLDIHGDQIAACVRVRVNGKYEEHHEVFGSFTDDLKKLARWLKEQRVRKVAMESTGVYWVPVWNVLEEFRYRFDLLLVNPAEAPPADPAIVSCSSNIEKQATRNRSRARATYPNHSANYYPAAADESEYINVGRSIANVDPHSRGKLISLAMGVLFVRHSTRVLVLLFAFLPVAKGVTLSDFAGTWTMDVVRSESARQDTPVTACTLTIRLVGTGVVTETTRSWGGKAPESRETLNLRLDGAETTSITDGGHAITAKARMDGNKLVVEAARTVNESTVTTKYLYSLAANGREMTVDMTLTVQHGYQGAAARNTGHGKDIFVRATR